MTPCHPKPPPGMHLDFSKVETILTTKLFYFKFCSRHLANKDPEFDTKNVTCTHVETRHSYQQQQRKLTMSSDTNCCDKCKSQIIKEAKKCRIEKITQPHKTPRLKWFGTICLHPLEETIYEKFTNKSGVRIQIKRHSNPKAPIHPNITNTQKRIKYERESFSIIL
jgi:hypothetical protein